VVFPVEADSSGDYMFPLVFTFNAGPKDVDFESPSGKVSVAAGTFSIWVGDTAVWTDVGAVTPTAKLDDFSFGLGFGFHGLKSQKHGRRQRAVSLHT